MDLREVLTKMGQEMDGITSISLSTTINNETVVDVEYPVLVPATAMINVTFWTSVLRSMAYRHDSRENVQDHSRVETDWRTGDKFVVPGRIHRTIHEQFVIPAGAQTRHEC